MSNALTSLPTPSRRREPGSRLRRASVALSHQMILQAARDEMAEKGPEHFSVPRVATRAQIALRTIYRHFPTRDALVDAMWLDAYPEFDWVLDTRSPSELTAAVARAFAEYDKKAALLKAAMRCARCDRLRHKTRPARVRKFARIMNSATKGLSPAGRSRALAALQLMVNPRAWEIMTTTSAADGADAGRAAAWAIRALVEKMTNDPASLDDL